MNTTLLIMAAGIGSRFGTGIKQLEPVDDANHTVIASFGNVPAIRHFLQHSRRSSRWFGVLCDDEGKKASVKLAEIVIYWERYKTSILSTANALQLSKASVTSYLPYQKGVYFPSTASKEKISVGAERQRRYRAMKRWRTDPTEENFWQRLEKCHSDMVSEV